jgi:energy-coupling factor transport system permease protein
VSLLLFTADPNTIAGRLNPISKVTALVIITLPLLVSRDALTSAILVAVELVSLPLLGLGPRLLARAWPILVGVGTLWLANFLVSGSIDGLLPVSLRLLALGLPGLLLVLSTDPTELADALVQKWHAPARVAYGALAAFRLIPLLAQELTSIRRARRARGVGAGWNPIGWVRTGIALLFALLVQAIRRGIRLAAAMDARGFDTTTTRTFARESLLRRADWTFMLAALLVTSLAVAVSVLTGHWRFLFS